MAATATEWAGPARLPRELARAGFEVSVLAPERALVAKSRYVRAVTYLPDATTPIQWAYLLAASLGERVPRLIVPCDDTALQLMMTFIETPPAAIEGSVRERLLTLIRDSLGDPRYYRRSIDKTLLPPAAEALGVRVPPFKVISDVDAAREFACTHGYPVVLKRAFGTAGQAVEVAPDEGQLEPAFRRLVAKGSTTLWSSADVLIQAWIPGKGL